MIVMRVMMTIIFQSCDGCDADGPDNCLKCAEGYSLRDNNFCVVDKTNTGKYHTPPLAFSR